jgi:hypothetical protein
MARYLISFDHGAMDHIPDEEGPAVRDASLAVIREAKDAGVWVFAQGVYPEDEVKASVVAPDGTVTDGARNNIAGVTIIDVPSREDALQWGRQARRLCPLRPRGPQVRARPGGGQMIARLGQCSGMTPDDGALSQRSSVSGLWASECTR